MTSPGTYFELLGAESANGRMPRLLPAILLIMAAGARITCGKLPQGANQPVFCWGDLSYGTDPALSVNRAEAVGGTDGYFNIVAGAQHVCAGRGGAVLCWGNNSRGQLGDGTTISRAMATPVANDLGLLTVRTAGTAHTCGFAGLLPLCWGANDHGQLGNGTSFDHSTPAPVVPKSR